MGKKKEARGRIRIKRRTELTDPNSNHLFSPAARAASYMSCKLELQAKMDRGASFKVQAIGARYGVLQARISIGDSEKQQLSWKQDHVTW